MAHKRMFSKDITGSDAFREMPSSAQSLYFHLGMDADDDGFLDSYKGLMRSINASEDDLRILIGKRFLILFPSKIIVVKHWKINNTIQKDRYHETKHLDEKRALILKENGAYTECIQDVSIMETQNRIGKERIVTADADFRIEKETGDTPSKEKKEGNAPYEKLCAWAVARTGRTFVNKIKQYTALKKAKSADISISRLKERWSEMEATAFYQTNGMDWTTVVSSFDRK